MRILVTGSVSVTGGSNVNLNGNPFQMRLWSQGAIAVASQSNVHAYLYAPAAAVSLTGQMNIVGAIQTRAPTRAPCTPPRRSRGARPTTCPPRRPTTPLPSAPWGHGGRWQLQPTANLATADPGPIEVTATDSTGGTSRVTVRVAIVPPTVALTAPVPGSLVGNRLVDLAGTCGTASSVTVNGRAAVVSGGTFHLTGFDLGAQDGLIALALAASDCGATVNATASLDLDTKAPVVAIDGPTEGDVFGASPITVTGTAVDAHLTSVTVNGVTAQMSGGRFTAAGVPLVQGNNPLVARATDALGRTADSAPVTVELDTVALTAAITDPASGAVVSTPQITVRGTALQAQRHPRGGQRRRGGDLRDRLHRHRRFPQRG